MIVTKIKQTLVVIMLFAGVVFCASGHIEKLVSATGVNTISDHNKKYLEDAFEKSLKGFLILSGIKSGLAVIEGSGIGVGFNLEIGDIVQSVYDYVDIAWKTALTGGTIIIMAQLILQLVALVNHWCLSFLFFLLLCLYLFHILSKTNNPVIYLLKKALVFTSITTLSLYLILPVSIRGAAFLSGKIINPLVKEAQDGFISVQNELSADAISKKLFPDDNTEDSWMAKLDLNRQYKKAKINLRQLEIYLQSKTKDIAVWTIKLIAAYLFDCLLFPIIFFSFFYLFIKFTMHNLFGNETFRAVQKIPAVCVLPAAGSPKAL